MPKAILVVDDEPVSLELAKRNLSTKGYTVQTATDGEKALELLKIFKPDLILLDVEMPNMNGYTFLMERAKIPELQTIPVIVLTAHQEVEPIFRRHKIKSYLLKPLNFTELLAKVEELIGLN